MSKILDTIKREILATKRSRYSICREAGISQTAMSRLMSGERGLGVESAEKLAKALGLTIEIRRQPRAKKGA